MTHSTGRLEDDMNQGQQDDDFDKDLAIAGSPSDPETNLPD